MYKSEAGTYQFDLKETVQLSGQQLPIEEIEDMELLPQVQIEERGEEISITGSLYLFGNYRGNLGAGKLNEKQDVPGSYEESVQFEPLTVERGPYSPLAKNDKIEYRIPVRINLPKGKVTDISDVYAYISSFDYELQNPYQFDVFASLIITGFKEKEEHREEEVKGSKLEFLHVASEQSKDPSEEAIGQRLQAIEEQIAGLEEEEVPEELYGRTEDTEIQEVEYEVAEVEYEVAIVNEEENLENEDDTYVYDEPRDEVPQDNVIPLPNLMQVEEEFTVPIELQSEELAKDVKVAISKKGTKQDRDPITSLSSIFSKPRFQDQALEAQEVAVEVYEDEERDHEALYLTNFMENREEKFTKVKLCIIQKDESLETIAERYKLHTETILRANQEARNQLIPGQILYIPVKG